MWALHFCRAHRGGSSATSAFSFLNMWISVKLSCFVFSLEGCDTGLAQRESLQCSHATLCIFPGMLGNLIWCPGRNLELGDLWDPFQLKPFYDSMILPIHWAGRSRATATLTDKSWGKKPHTHSKALTRSWSAGENLEHILPPPAEDPTETSMWSVSIFSLTLAPVPSWYVLTLRSVHMGGQMLPVITCITVEGYMW